MIKELLDGLRSRLKGVGEKSGGLPPAGGIPSATSEATLAFPASATPSGPVAPSTEDFTALLGGGDTSELENKVKALEDKTNKLESTVKETLDITKSNKSRLDSIDANMKKFLSLYEVVTNQINPFVDSGPPFKRALPKVEEKAEPEPDKIVMPSAEELEKGKPEEPLQVEEKVEPVKPMPPIVEPKGKTVAPDDVEKVMFMQSIKDGNSSFVLEWITSLVSEDGGVEKNTKLLKYLLTLGWITPKAYEALMQHMWALVQSGKVEQKREQRIPLTVGVPSGFAGLPQPQWPIRFQGIPQVPPQISQLNNVDSLMTVLDWVKYLVEKVGHQEASDILRYLVQLEWITPEAHAALVNYIEKSAPHGQAGDISLTFNRIQQKPESRVTLAPNQIPNPEEFMRAEFGEYRIPIQPTQQVPTPLQPQTQYVFPTMPSQTPRRQPARGAAEAIIPLTELGSDIDSLAIVLEWIRYLVDRAGTQGAKSIFNYYQNIGWVDKNVCQQLIRYVDGIKAKEEETVGYQPTVEDHATSLFFISKLKHMDLSEDDINSMLGR